MANGDHTYSTGWDSVGDGRSGEANVQDPNGLIGADPQQAGRVRGTRPAYGGYTSTVKVGPDGKLYNDAGASGQNDAINRYRSLGEAAASRAAYKVDYTAANEAQQQAADSRMGQRDAMAGLRTAAEGGAPSMTTGIGRGMIDSQLQGQIGASAGARGMGMAAAAHRGMYGAAMQGAQNAGSIAGMRAGELMDARGAYAGGANTMRGQDYAGMSMSQHQAIAQAQSEMAQRRANAHQRMGYEGLAYGVNQTANNASMAADQADEGLYGNSLAIDAAEKNRAVQQRGATIGAIGAGMSIPNYGGGGGGGGGGAPSYGGGGGIDRNNPYGDDGIDRNNPY